MNALFDTLDLTVAYASEALIPENTISGLQITHERLDHAWLEGIVETVGGKVTGEYVMHSNGESLDIKQFEKIEMEGENV